MTVFRLPYRRGRNTVRTPSLTKSRLVSIQRVLLLFLDRIAEVRIDVERADQRPYRRRLHRRHKSLGVIPKLQGSAIYEVDVGEGRRFLVVRREVDKERGRAALGAFQVWRASSARVDDELQEAELHVPTLSCWQPANRAVFSSSWTPVGRTLENYLMEAAEVSADCRRARDLMLVGQQDWPVSVQDAKRHWGA